MGRVVPEISIEFICEIFAKNYRIIDMIVSENEIDILTVHHTSKELKITDFQ
jgi:toxin ParE1/3/4